MSAFPLQTRGISGSRLVLGCMRVGEPGNPVPAEEVFEAAWDAGIRMFDHADIYQGGRAEAACGEWLGRHPDRREQLVIQSKCGIRPGRYDCSRRHILAAVDGILERLGTPWLDILLLHRPDPLLEPVEVAEAFAELQASGRVRHFGVSNMNVPQVRLLQRALPMPLVVNQLEMSLARLDWVDDGVHVNHPGGPGTRFPAGMLEYAAMHDIQLQAWGALGRGAFSGRSLEDAATPTQRAAGLVAELAADKGTSPEAIVLGWLLRHPARIQPVVGTTSPQRILACRDALQVAGALSREEWYSLYLAARGGPIP